MKRAKKVLALALAFLMLSSTFATFGSAISGGHFAEVEESEADASITYVVSIYRNAGTADSPNWVPTKVAKPGEEVRARIAIDSGGEITQAGDMIIVWDSDMFTDLIPTDTEEVDFIVNSTDSFTKTYEAKARIYSSGYEAWDYLAENVDYYDDDEEEHTYISEEMHDKYANSWTYVFFSSTTSGVLSKDTWLFEIPLKVKDDATDTDMAVGVVEDAFTGYYIGLMHDKEYDLSPTSYAPMFGLTLGTSQWFDQYLPYVTTIDATLSTTNTVKLDGNGGTLTATSAEGAVGATVTPTAAATAAPSGKSTSNIKWSTDPDCAYADASTTVSIGYETGDDEVTYYAIYDAASGVNYTIQYFEMDTDGNYPTNPTSTLTPDGTAGAEIDVTALESFSVPEGFSLDEENSIKTVTVSTDDTDIAKIYFARNQYSTNWVVNGENKTTTGYYGAAITAPTLDVIPGKNFVGWAETANGDTTEDFGEIGVNAKTFYAVYTTDVAFDVNGGTWDDESFDSIETRAFADGAAVTAPGTPTKKGYTFQGWNAEQSATAGSKDLGTMSASTPAKYYAIYKGNTYKFFAYSDWDPETDTYSGGAPTSVTFGPDAKLLASQLASNAPTGYQLDHWSATQGGEDFFTEGEYVLDGEEATVTNLYPVFVKQEHSLTINYSGAGDKTPEQYNGTFAYGDNYNVASPAVEGYTPNPTEITGTMGTSDVTANVAYTLNKHSITFKVNGAETKVFYDFGASVEEPETPDIPGYDFTGWSQPIPDTMPDEDLVITAVLEKKTFTITYIVDGVEATDLAQNVLFDDEFTLADIPEAEDGRTMGSWVLYNGEDVISKPAKMPAYNIVAKATSTANAYKVIYKIDGVEQKDLEQIVACGDPINLTYTPEPGYEYTFGGADASLTEMPARDIYIDIILNKINYNVNLYSKADAEADYALMDETGITGTIGTKITVDMLEGDIPEDASYFGYEVIGWSLIPNGEAIEPDDDDVLVTIGTDDVDLYAVYGPKDVIVTFIFDEGIDDVESTFSFGDKITPPDIDELRPGYEVVEWLKLEIVEGEGDKTVTDWDEEIVDQEDDLIYYFATTQPKELPLVINYSGAGEDTPDAYEGTVAYGDEYEVESPEVTGYTADPLVVSGEMDNVEGKTINVVYTANEYDLVITYVGAGNKTPAPHEEKVAFGSTYSVETTQITGYTVDKAVVSGTMGAGKVEVTVTYTPVNCTLTIYYEGAGAATPTTHVDTKVPFDSEFSVDSPDVTGYIPDEAVISGIMDDVDGLEFTVTYTANEYDLVINYIGAGEDNPEQYIGKVAFNSAFTVDTPAVTGYEPDFDVISGTMNNVEGLEYTVTYSPVECDLTITYVGAGEDTPEQFIGKVDFNTEFSVDTPDVTGYEPDFDVISGTMNNVGGLEFTVTYSPVECDLVITFEGAGELTPEQRTEKVNFNETYSFEVPEIDGYTASPKVVEGKMDTVGKEVTVTYVADGHTLTITYSGAGDLTPETYTDIIATGAEYSVETPVITGYTADYEKVEGTMGTTDVKVDVLYTPVNCTLTIFFEGAGNATPTTRVIDNVPFGTEYSVDVPEIEGYTPSVEKVTGIMSDVDGEEITVTYTANEYDLVINYIGAGEATPAQYTGKVAFNSEFSVDSPEVTGYTPDKAVVSGTMNSIEGLEYTVEYTAGIFTITFSAGDGEFAEGTQVEFTDAYGTAITAPVPTRQGYQFAGWAPAFDGTIPADNVTYTAQWSDGTTTPYTVEIFLMNADGSYSENATAVITGNQGTTGSTITLNTTTNIPDGYYFDEENSVPSGTIAADGSLVLTICYARNKYVVTFDGEEKEVFHGAAIEYPVPEVEAGKTFLGWSRTEGADAADEDLPVYATEALDFYSVIGTATYTINYYVDFGDGFELAKQDEYAYGAEIEDYIPEKTGCTFSGWNEEIPETMPEEDLVRYASFTVNTNTVKYVSSIDESVISTFNVAYGDSVPTITAPEVEYYTFREFSGYVDTMPDNELVVYVCYDRVPVKLIPKTPEATTIIDRDRDLVYGLDDYMTYNRLVEEFLDVEGDGYMVITPADEYNGIGLYGTGSIVDVYDRVTDELVESFTIIIFGDLNGDGRVTTSDTSIIAKEVNGITEWSFDLSDDYDIIKSIAADVNHDGNLSTGDTSLEKQHVAEVDTINQCPDLTSYTAPC